VAITDHSERAWSSRKLAAADVAKQREEVDAVRRETPDLEILHGVEVDIMHDGSLDFDDELLEGFDLVLASLHDPGGHDQADPVRSHPEERVNRRFDHGQRAEDAGSRRG
jgi:histidinol phosphatase-like PHP family hydrolase